MNRVDAAAHQEKMDAQRLARENERLQRKISLLQGEIGGLREDLERSQAFTWIWFGTTFLFVLGTYGRVTEILDGSIRTASCAPRGVYLPNVQHLDIPWCGTGGGRIFLRRGNGDTSIAGPLRPQLAEERWDGADRRRERRRMA